MDETGVFGSWIFRVFSVGARIAAAAGALAGKFKNDRALLRSRVNAALDTLNHQELCDSRRVAAIGYCFGGTTVLELARSGADLAGVVSFHGGLDTPNPVDAKNIKAKVLICTGADDKAATMPQVSAFEEEMRQGKVDYQITIYGAAVHAFTNPASSFPVFTPAAMSRFSNLLGSTR